MTVLMCCTLMNTHNQHSRHTSNFLVLHLVRLAGRVSSCDLVFLEAYLPSATHATYMPMYARMLVYNMPILTFRFMRNGSEADIVVGVAFVEGNAEHVKKQTQKQ